MKKSALFFFAVFFLGSSLYGQEKYFELSGFATLNNSYLIGPPMQKWMNDDIQSGSPAFFNIGGTSFFPLNTKNTVHLGVGMTFNIPPSHSIWGSNLYYGGRNELVLSPYMLSLDMPLRLGFGNSGLSMTMDPALLMGFLGGKYSTNGNVNVEGTTMTGTFQTSLGSMGAGFGMALGAEFSLGAFGIGIKYGARILKSAVYFNYNNGSKGVWSPVENNKEIKLDLGGSYLSVGLMLRLGRKTLG
jgi:hypothetical protein